MNVIWNIASTTVGEAIRRAVKRSGAKSRLAAIAISGDAAITKVIQMPKNLGENELEGQVEMLLSQVEKRFGRVPPAVGQRIAALKPAQLKRAGLRLLDAQHIEDLFAR